MENGKGTGVLVVRVHTTHLMRAGEVVLWRKGRIVWQGCVGADVSGLTFDAMSMSVDDAEQFNTRRGGVVLTAEVVITTLSEWWIEG